jgi:hypothetical protein
METTIPPEVYEELKKRIFEDLELTGLSEKEKEDILQRIGRIIFEMALIRILDEMDDETAKEFEQFLEKNQNPDDILKFLKEKVPDFEEILEDEARKFKAETFDVLKEAKLKK